jgi:DMSO reductase anchor subunit
VRGVLSPFTSTIIYDIPLILGISSGYTLQLYWYIAPYLRQQAMTLLYRIELITETKMQAVLNVKKTRPVLITLVILSIVFPLPIHVIKSIYATTFLSVLYNGFFIIMTVWFIISTTFVGRKLKKMYATCELTPTIIHFLTRVLQLSHFISECSFSSQTPSML